MTKDQVSEDDLKREGVGDIIARYEGLDARKINYFFTIHNEKDPDYVRTILEGGIDSICEATAAHMAEFPEMYKEGAMLAHEEKIMGFRRRQNLQAERKKAKLEARQEMARKIQLAPVKRRVKPGSSSSIVSAPEMEEIPQRFQRGLKPGPNEPCPCPLGGGRKFKKCCQTMDVVRQKWAEASKS